MEAPRIHMVGIGGMGMAPLAIYLFERGWKVTGEDDHFHPCVHQALRSRRIPLGKKVDWEELDGVIYSNAIPLSHKALSLARDAGCEIVRRGEFLARLGTTMRLIGVAGSHGKTTTTGMLAYAFDRAGVPINYILGGLFADSSIPPARHVAESDWLLVEMDESDGSIEQYHPDVTVILNVDWDHPDHYSDEADCLRAFAKLVERTKQMVILGEDTGLAEVVAGCEIPVYQAGFTGDYAFTRLDHDRFMLSGRFGERQVRLPFPEKFNQCNAVIALSVLHGFEAGFDEDVLADFEGIWRRQELLYQHEHLRVIQDYGHHPTEIRNLLDALEAQGLKPLTVVFQPHRYSRTRQFKRAFAEALGRCQQLLLMPVYGAGERPIPGGSSAELFDLVSDLQPHLEVVFCKDSTKVLRHLEEVVGDFGTVLFLGAGDIEVTASAFVRNLLRERGEAGDFLSRVQDQLPGHEMLLRANEVLGNKTTLRVGGVARYYAEPTSMIELQLLLREAHLEGLPVNMLGRGSNVLIPDEGLPGLVLRLNRMDFCQLSVGANDGIRAGAGVRLKELCGYARRMGMSGFEFLEGIPGSVGGALRMNAGAMGGWISQVVSDVTVIDLQGKVRTFHRKELHFEYRKCIEFIDAIVIEAGFEPQERTELEQIQEKLDVYANQRKDSQPRLPSAGCSFKNPEGAAAGQLIDQCGLKGLRVGDAEVSDVHANFVVNRGRASFTDVVRLLNEVRREVFRRTGKVLEPEIVVLGNDWNNLLDELEKEPCS